jgi:hypothetical protein
MSSGVQDENVAGAVYSDALGSAELTVAGPDKLNVYRPIELAITGSLRPEG